METAGRSKKLERSSRLHCSASGMVRMTVCRALPAAIAVWLAACSPCVAQGNQGTPREWWRCPLTSPPRFLVRFDGKAAVADFLIQELTEPGDFHTVRVELRDLEDKLIASKAASDTVAATPDGFKPVHFECSLPAPGIYRVNVHWRRRAHYTIRLVRYNFHTDNVCVERVEFPREAWDTLYFMAKAGSRSVAFTGKSWHGTGAEITVLDDADKQRGVVKIAKEGEKWTFREKIEPPAQDSVWLLRIRGLACGGLSIPGYVSPNALFLKELCETVLPCTKPEIPKGLRRVQFIDIGDASDAAFIATAGPRRIEGFKSVRQVKAKALPQPHARFGGFGELTIPTAPDSDLLLKFRVLAPGGGHGTAFCVLVNGEKVRVGRAVPHPWGVVEAKASKRLIDNKSEATVRIVTRGAVFLDWLDVLAARDVSDVVARVLVDQSPPCASGKFVKIAPGGRYLVLDGKPWYPVGGGGYLGAPPVMRCDLGGSPEPAYSAQDWTLFAEEWRRKVNCFKKGTGNYSFGPIEKRHSPGDARSVKLASDWRTYFQACRKYGLRTVMCLSTSGGRPAETIVDRQSVEHFKAWVRYMVPQFKDEPAIASWAICNEPNAFQGVTNEQLLAWHEEIAKLIKELDPNHLVGADMQETPSAVTGRIVARAPSIDWVSDHPYCDFESMVARVKYIQCGKPVLINECWRNEPEEFKDFMMHALFSGVAGFHCWMGFPYTDEHWARMAAFLKLVRRLDMNAFAPAPDIAVHIPVDVWCSKQAQAGHRNSDLLSVYPNAKILFDAGVPFDLIADRDKEGKRYKLVVGPTEPGLDEHRIAPFRLVTSKVGCRFLVSVKRGHYLVWFKAEKGVTVTLREVLPGQYAAEWIDVATGDTIMSKNMRLSDVAELVTPCEGELVLYVHPAP